MRRRIALAGAVAALAATAFLLGGVFRDPATPAPAAVVAPQALDDVTAGVSSNGSTTSLVLDLQASLSVNPADERSWLLLGLAYQQRARESGDPTYYSKSEGALRRALALDPGNDLTISGLGSLALSRHRFREALRLGERARRLAPSTARHYGVVGDALVELGRYHEAFRAFDKMAGLRPSLSAYARISYARELLGRTGAAIRAMQLAVEAASGAEPAAWTHVQLGKLHWNHGRYGAASREYRIALATLPGYAYGLDALAQVEAARGHYARAVALERQAVDQVPLPQYVGFLGDLYQAAGQVRLAREQYALIGAIEKLLNANGVRTDLEIALFDVDHGIRTRQALERARLGRAERPSIDGDDVLAWALERNGRCAEALPYSKRALRLGTHDALKFFHRGMIERCLGHTAAARLWLGRALRLNPHFSPIWTPVARRLGS